MRGRSEFEGVGEYRLHRGGLLDKDIMHRLERLCLLREECRARAEKAGRRSFYDEADRQLNRGPRLRPAYYLLAGWHENED